MDTIGTFEMAEALFEYDMCTALHKHYTVDQLTDFYSKHSSYDHLLFYTMGIGDGDFEKFYDFCDKNGPPKNICVDVANGYMTRFPYAVSEVRKAAPNSIIMAGNVVDATATYRLVEAGASIVKVGIGSGSACTTRLMTGVGRPQLSTVLDCANAAHGMNALICSDGGCVHPGDVNKAIGGGADFVMLGGMLSGHDECGGEVMDVDGNKFMQYYGMSSDTAMNKHSGGVANYRTSEGRTLMVPYRGPVSGTVEKILGGLRSYMLYVGAQRLKEASKCTEFIEVTSQLNTSLAKYEKG
jgi:GMP reductase